MMKGKGKKGKEIEEKTSSPVHEFKKIDLSKECPKYLEILDRNIDEGIKLEELDALQLELEALLVSVVYRKRKLQDEVDCSLNLQDSKNRPKDSIKRSKGDEHPNKKLKEDADNSDNSSDSSSESSYSNSSSSSFSSSSSKSSLKAKVKNLKVNKFDETKFNSSYNTPTHNDVPNQFWAYVSTFCDPIKNEYLKMLEDLVSLYESEPDILKAVNKSINNGLTSNGKLLSTGEQNGTKKDETKKNKKEKKKGLSAVNSEGKPSKKSKDKLESGDKCDYGVLTQRLVSCLIEEDFCAENFEDIFEEFSPDNKNATDAKMFKTISLNNAAQFEKLLRKELQEHGLIDADDILLNNEGSDNEDDEVNQEIVRCQNELRSVMTQNQFQIKKLINLIRADLRKQQILKRLDQVNEEILEISKRLIIIKQKRKNSKEAKKEREAVQKHLKERQTLLEQLNLEKLA